MREYRSEELPDPRNAEILVSIDGKLLPRSEAKISVFDSSVQGGDAVWEGLRVYAGRIFKLDAHLERLCASAHALAFERVPKVEKIRQKALKKEFVDLVKNANTDGKLEPEDNDLAPEEEGLPNNDLTRTAAMDDQSRNFEEGSESDGLDTFRERAKPKSKKSSSSGQVGY